MKLRLANIVDKIRDLESQAFEPLCAYIYDLPALQQHAAYLVSTLPESCELFYAIKANSDLPILQTLAPIVAGFEVSSGGELAWVRKFFPEKPVVFSGPGKIDQELDQAIDQNVDCVHVESINELQRLASLCIRAEKSISILLRVNIAIDNLSATTLMMGGKPTPFGISIQDLPECIYWIQAHPEIRLNGFHFHLLSHQLDAEDHLQLIELYLKQAHLWCENYGIKINHINVGGGIGINYRHPERQFDWDIFSSKLKLLLSNCVLPEARVRFELGRYVTAACGYYVMQVIDIKRNFDQNFIVGRGGSHHFRTPFAQGHSHPFYVVPINTWQYRFPRPEISNDKVNVVGQLCTPKDLISFDSPVKSVRCGDMLVFPYAGAYAWHISHHDFLRHPHPQQWYLPLKE